MSRISEMQEELVKVMSVSDGDSDCIPSGGFCRWCGERLSDFNTSTYKYIPREEAHRADCFAVRNLGRQPMKKVRGAL